MPKMKTKSAAKKRFKITGTGKVTHTSAFKRHILTSKSSKRKRHMRGNLIVSPGDAVKVKRMLPY